MKKIFTLFAAVLISAHVLAQAPQKMSYQAVIRNSSNALIASTQVGMKISILQTTDSGTAVYIETQTPTTNSNGLVSLAIGTGITSDNFAGIDWSAGPYFIKTETDPTGGTSYSITVTSQLMSVPFALYAANSGNAGVPYTGATAAVDLGAYDLTLNGMTIGLGSGQAITNTASGRQALWANNTGVENTAIGANTILFNTTGSHNTASGYQALQGNTTGNSNTAYGVGTLLTNGTGNNLTAIGFGANVAIDGLTNATALGYDANVSTSNTIQLGNSSVTNVNTAGKVTTGAVTYPNTDGVAGQVLQTNGSGIASWVAPASDQSNLVSNLQTQLDNQNIDINFLKSTNLELQSKVSDLINVVNGLNEAKLVLQSNVSQLQTNISDLQFDNQQIRNQIMNLEDRFMYYYYYNPEIDMMRNQIMDLEYQINMLQQAIGIP